MLKDLEPSLFGISFICMDALPDPRVQLAVLVGAALPSSGARPRGRGRRGPPLPVGGPPSAPPTPAAALRGCCAL